MAEDEMMVDDGVVDSTELNGDHSGRLETIDPTVITLGQSHGHPFVGGKSKQPSGFPPDQTEVSLSPSPNTASDNMDIAYSHLPKVEVRIPPPPRFPPLPYASSKTGLVYDARMRFHCEPVKMTVRSDTIHPEDPRRIHEIFQEIQQAGLVQGPDAQDDEARDEQCWRIHARFASKGEICLIHTPQHYDFIESLQEKTEKELEDLSEARDSIYFHNSTFDCARLAAGGAIEACRAVVRGDVRNAIAIIRPPGHHAECDQASGFCVFNNVPIAARVCQNDFPKECRKVLILDWDVHHGNGIQHAFYDDPNVLYISLHVYRNGQFYPCLPDGNLTYCGEGAGLGKNVNIPWPAHGMGDAEYLYAFQEVVMPIATEFDPDLVIISAGFDAAEGDELGGCHVTPACYAHMTHMLMRLAKGKIAVCLEGGYNLRSIARSALAVTRTLMLQPPDRLEEDLPPPREDAVRTVAQVKREHSRYWKCLFPREPEVSDMASSETLRLHDIIRDWQSKVLTEAHQMIPLTIKKSGFSQTFEHNVMATPKFMEEHPLLVIFHDPPGWISQSDPVTGRVEPHNSWLTNDTKSYIDWAINEGFEIIDVNVPKMVTIEDEDGDIVQTDASDARAQQTRLLANYLWENYIEPHDATQVFLMGIGTPYTGLVELLSNNGMSTTEDNGVQHLIGFISGSPIPSIRRATDDYIPLWFYEHTTVFVAYDHLAWDPNRQRKLRKKYGKLVKSSEMALHAMLQAHKREVQELLSRMKREYEEKHSRSRTSEEEREVGPPTPRTAKAPGQGPGSLPPMGVFSSPIVGRRFG
ncbi:putative histone deacetylase [Westerdykella ornata]|uniref:Histone deacetylase n=1 Tax=Westerdykella ornata TaxID=318751 RepID=A0A6A6JVU1_WESOR|nr:putative histone deacetylase [Westerdykella ornata]KAF2280344.1 putative histone deacetylase [Westerdykella ornata]